MSSNRAGEIVSESCEDCGTTERLVLVGKTWLCDPCRRVWLAMERFHDY